MAHGSSQMPRISPTSPPQVASSSDSLEQMAARKATLESRVAELTAQLEAGFLKRNREEVFEGLSRELLVFTDKLKDLRDKLKPDFMRTVTRSPESLAQLNEAVSAYNGARNALYEAHESRLQQVRLYWERELLTYQLEEIYRLALIGIPSCRSTTGPSKNFAMPLWAKRLE